MVGQPYEEDGRLIIMVASVRPFVKTPCCLFGMKKNGTKTIRYCSCAVSNADFNNLVPLAAVEQYALTGLFDFDRKRPANDNQATFRWQRATAPFGNGALIYADRSNQISL